MRLLLAALLALLLILEVVLCVHTPPKGKTRTEIRRPKIPKDFDFNKLPLSELVKYRPRRFTNSKQGQKYAGLFAMHPEIARINLNNPKKSDTVQALLELGKEGTKDFKNHMTRSIQLHIDTALFGSEEDKKALVKMLNFERRNRSRIERYKTHKDKVGNKTLNQQRKEYDRKFLKENGVSYRITRVQAHRENPYLGKPLAFHFDRMGLKNPDPLLAEAMARHLQDFYPTKAYLTLLLDRYLKERKTPQEQYLAAMTARASHLKEQADIEKPARKGQKRTSSAFANTQVAILSGAGASQMSRKSTGDAYVQTGAIWPHNHAEVGEPETCDWLHQMPID